MIYGNAILEQQYEKLFNIDPIEFMTECYQNEIDILNSVIDFNNRVNSINEDNDLVTHDKFVNADYTVSDSKKSFIQNIIDKMKEIIKKFIDWCKKILNSIKKFIIKDSETLKKELNDTIKDIQKAKSISELKKYSKKVGFVTKAKGEQFVLVFNVKKYIESLNEKYKEILNTLNKANDLYKSHIDLLNKNKKLSDDEFKSSDDIIELLKVVYKKPRKTDRSKYYNAYNSIDKEKTLETFKAFLIQTAKTSIESINYIDTNIDTISKNIKVLENNANNALSDIDRLKADGDYDEKSLTITAKLVNTTLSIGKAHSQMRIKELQSIKNIYRTGDVATSFAKDLYY